MKEILPERHNAEADGGHHHQTFRAGIAEETGQGQPLIFSFRKVNMKLWTDKNQKAKTETGQEMKEIQYEIVKEIAVLSASDSGYTKEINLISWNGKEPKYDVRSFSPNREKCGKGITLNADEAAALLKALQKEVNSGD